jgi:phosphonate transport system substrate-binding protein
METLNISSWLAPNTDAPCHDITAYLDKRLDTTTKFVGDISWPERERLLHAGEIHVCWICGLPYVHQADQPEPIIELLVAPVMAGDRYGNRPVYFSDVVVRRHSPYHTFADLRGAVWAYNESSSHSGYNLTRYHLARLGHSAGFFGRALAAGTHQAALQMVMKGTADAAAIDTMVLDFERQQRPQMAGQIRVVETLGPSPVPPWVVRRDVPPGLRQELRALLVTMTDDGEGKEILQRWGMARLETAVDSNYDPIRHMARVAAPVKW